VEAIFPENTQKDRARRPDEGNWHRVSKEEEKKRHTGKKGRGRINARGRVANTETKNRPTVQNLQWRKLTEWKSVKENPNVTSKAT